MRPQKFRSAVTIAIATSSFWCMIGGGWIAGQLLQDPQEYETGYIEGTVVRMSSEQSTKFQTINERYLQEIAPWTQSFEQAEKQLRQLQRAYSDSVWQVLDDKQHQAILANQRHTLGIVASESVPYFSGMAKFMAFAAQAEAVVALEGLTRDEDGNVIKPATEERMLKIHEHLFHETKLSLSVELELELWKLLCQPGTFQPYAGPKLCGGFHPDVCLRLQWGDLQTHVLICLTCEEAQIDLPDLSLRVDFDADAMARVHRWCQQALIRH